ncbi:hypothetical protein [Herbaspirillum huttiense]|uniref:hypothetical protein n=1 Tax=Herbaspirillum huttiense TaxID=863372 RepID=UPI0005854D5A|nr:hypothetical protein [Herbaspirillum huttiense]MBN9357671.1 hypothetical protein [Herbaspirillum huttiense]
MIKKKLGRLMVLMGVLSAPMLSGQAADSSISAKVHESKFFLPFPIRREGEVVDVLVKVDKTNRAYGFYLVLVEDLSWPIERKEALRRIQNGWVGGDEGTLPYPFKLRLRIEPLDKKNSTNIDLIVKERSPAFSQYVNHDKEIWRAQKLYLGGLPEGIYRVRLENLVAVPHIDFGTLFVFEKDTRKF